MLRALLLVLSLLLAVPTAAMPACHDPAATAQRGHDMSGEHHRQPDAAPAHACLGCIPPATLLATPLPAPSLAPASPSAPRIATLDLGREHRPLLPPPRLG